MYIACAVLISGWIALTALNHLPVVSKWLGRLDVGRVLPKWSFFAPNPGMHDYILAFRTFSVEGGSSNWRNTELRDCRPRWASIWNPHRRESKALNDIVQTIRRNLDGDFDEKTIPLSTAYLMVLAYVNNQAAIVPGAQRIQFVLLQSTGHQDRALDVAFLSQIHPIAFTP